MSVRANFNKIREDQEKLASLYEEQESWEMAYLALWSILEHAMKNVANIAVRNNLKAALLQWVNYVDGKAKDQPQKIRSFAMSYGQIKIPDVPLIEGELGGIEKITENYEL